MTHLATYYTSWREDADLGLGLPRGYEYYYRFRYELYYTQDKANNTSSVRVQMYVEITTTLVGTSDYGIRVYTTGTIDGTNYNRDIYVSGNKTETRNVLVGSGTKTISHNSDGTKTFTFSGAGRLERPPDLIEGFPTLYTGAKSITLPNIPRGTTISSFTRSNITLNSFRVNWSTAHTVDRVRYRTRVGTGSWTSWTTGQTGDRKSGNFTISGLNPNTTYGVQIEVRRKDSQITTTSSQANVKTLNIATLNSVPNNINLENPFTITFNRNGASNVNIGIYDTAGNVAIVPYREATGTSYTFELTEEEKNALFNDMSTVNSKTYRIYLNTNDNDYRVNASRTFVITDANPIFSNFEYEDINPLTLDLTGDNQTIIKGYSNLKAIITSANKMEAIKGANPKEYQLVVGAKQTKVNYSDDNDVEMTLNNIDNNVFIVYAIDSRSNSTQKQISPANYIDYFKPTIGELTVSRENNISTYTNLSFSGTFFNANFGAENNTLTATYEYLNTKTEEWKAGDTPLNLTINDNDFSFDGLIAGDLNALGFDISESFEIRVKIEDMLTDESRVEILVSAKPNIALHKDGTSINAQFDETIGNGVQLNGDGIYYNGLLLFGWSEE